MADGTSASDRVTGRALATEAVAALMGAALSATVEVPDTLANAGKAVHGHTPDFPVVLTAADRGGAVGLAAVPDPPGPPPARDRPIWARFALSWLWTKDYV